MSLASFYIFLVFGNPHATYNLNTENYQQLN